MFGKPLTVILEDRVQRAVAAAAAKAGLPIGDYIARVLEASVATLSPRGVLLMRTLGKFGAVEGSPLSDMTLTRAWGNYGNGASGSDLADAVEELLALGYLAPQERGGFTLTALGAQRLAHTR